MIHKVLLCNMNSKQHKLLPVGVYKKQVCHTNKYQLGGSSSREACQLFTYLLKKKKVFYQKELFIKETSKPMLSKKYLKEKC